MTQCWQGTIHSLASVNFCLGCVGVIQVGRIIAYNRSLKKSTGEQVNEVKDGIVASAEGVKDDVKAAVAR
jgi:mitochondrial pyruvate carrier 2